MDVVKIFDPIQSVLGGTCLSLDLLFTLRVSIDLLHENVDLNPPGMEAGISGHIYI